LAQHLASANEIGRGAFHGDVVSFPLLAQNQLGGNMQAMTAEIEQRVANA
jgi:hypothetical protein